MNVIREFIQFSLIDERIRSKRFDMREFKKLTDSDEIYDRAVNSGLREIGRGGGRAVFVLNSSKVLKVAIPNAITGEDDDFGHEQNEAEFELSQHPTISNAVAKVFEHGPSFTWIISELVRPINDTEEFQALLGTDIGMKTLVDAVWYNNVPELKRFVDKHKLNTQKAHALLAGLRSMNKRNVNVHDIKRLEHWGKTADGRLVLLDYGLIDGNYGP